MSAKPPRSSQLSIAGPAGSLEAIVEIPADVPPVGAAVVCHPHPQYGGTMHNKVAHTLARSFVRSGYTALRFNFRGTEGSEGEYDDGVGEVDDALAALQWMRQEQDSGPIWLAGFSFGAAIALRAAVQDPVDGLITVAPAVSRFASGLETQPKCPWLVVQGDQDELVDIEETISWFNGLEPGPELAVLEDAEHFFHGRLVDLREIVTDFLQKKAGENPGS
ncbi:MAG: alpha/beta hydrolase [Woeseiaceae bacterium]